MRCMSLESSRYSGLRRQPNAHNLGHITCARARVGWLIVLRDNPTVRRRKIQPKTTAVMHPGLSFASLRSPRADLQTTAWCAMFEGFIGVLSSPSTRLRNLGHIVDSFASA